MRLRSILAAVALLSAPLIARADTIFNLAATFAGGGTINGTIDINTSSGTVDSADLTVAGTAAAYNGTLDDIAYQISRGSVYQVDITGPGFLYLYLPVSTLVGYTGSSSVCLGNATCDYNTSIYAGPDEGGLISGSLEPEIAPTPEPSSFLLLATGLLGTAALIRRRLLTSRF